MYPPLPVPDEVSAPFWAGARRGQLLIQRCARCRRYTFPPRPGLAQVQGAELALVTIGPPSATAGAVVLGRDPA